MPVTFTKALPPPAHSLQLRAAGLHLDEHALGPQQVGELLPARRSSGFAPCPRTLALDQFELRRAGLFRHAELEGRARLDDAPVAEGAEQVIQECL